MSSSMPGISFQLQSNRVYIFHSTILALDEPKYIRLLFNPEKKHLAVQACARRKPESFVVPRYEPETWAFPISSFPLSKMLSECCSWERDKTYRVYGELHKDYHLDVPMNPAAKGQVSMNAWFTKLTEADFQKERDEVLCATAEDIRKTADLVEAALAQNHLCVIGSEAAIQKEKDLFGAIDKL